MEVKNVFYNKDIGIEDLGKGVSRKILAYDKNLMTVEVFFEEGAVGEMHSHPHEQITYVLEGKFEFTIGGEKYLVEAGDTLYKQSNIEHGAICLEKGRLLDIFTPAREDFLKK
ncbi:MAG: cupin domain-containing protein [Tissierellaceae bacterium]|nr:cupin domain-containing protein [Tissierellia bacterium]